jgi:hypothetical protein
LGKNLLVVEPNQNLTEWLTKANPYDNLRNDQPCDHHKHSDRKSKQGACLSQCKTCYNAIQQGHQADPHHTNPKWGNTERELACQQLRMNLEKASR